MSETDIPYHRSDLVFSATNQLTNVLLLFTILGVVYILWKSSGSRSKPEWEQEPPLATTSIPVWGHLIGLLWHQLKYFDILSAQHSSWPIFTIDIFGSQTYVIRSPHLVQVALKNPKAFSFDPFSLMFSRKALGGSKKTMAIMEHVPTEKGESAYLIDLHTAMYGALALGPSLLETNKRVLDSLVGYLNQIQPQGQDQGLYSWLKVLYTMSSAEALYGPGNPFSLDPSLVDNVWDFEETFNMLMLNVIPSITAARAHKARRALTSAFTKYYDAGHFTRGNQFVQGRAAVARKWGMTNTDCGSFEIGIIYASTTNATPTAFWMLCYILSDLHLASQLSTEISQVVTHTTIDHKRHSTMDITSFSKKCPLLVACFHETLRLVNAGTSIRWVMEDTLLDDSYLLKKNSIVQMPASVLHHDETIWGPNPQTFNPHRFLDTDHLTKDQRKQRKEAFIPFGGGKHLCPGRHLAFTEIVAFVAMVIYGFEIQTVVKSSKEGDVEGTLEVPKAHFMKIGNNTRKPDGDVEVRIRRKREFEGVLWRFDVGDEVDFGNLSPE